VILPEMEVCAFHANATHAVDILAFIGAQEIPFLYFETPYTLSPAPGGESLYALLRETLRSTGKIGIAYVVIQARQHLAALIPHGQSLVLSTLRWDSESLLHDRLEDESNEATAGHGDWDLTMPLSRTGRMAPQRKMAQWEAWHDGECFDDVAPLAQDGIETGNLTAIAQEEPGPRFDANDDVSGDSDSDSDGLAFSFPRNPHAAPANAPPRRATPRWRQPLRRAHVRFRHPLH
jgi:hypothetical protein